MKRKIEKIYRSVESIESDGRTIRGVACVVNSWSKDLGGFREIIRPEALTQELLERSDIQLNVDHDPSRMLARSKRGNGSLKLSITERGLEFETTAPDTQLGHDMLEMLKRGDYSQCSFCFTLKPDSDRFWWEGDQGYREIKSFDKLYDVSIVYDPAYDATQVDARSMEKLQIIANLAKLENEINNIDIYED